MSSIRILIADDNAIVRDLVRKFLESEFGWAVCGEAENGDEAIEKAIALKPDLLLLDMSMPKIDGWKTCDFLRTELPDMRILLVTEQDPVVLQALARRPESTAL